MARLAGGLGRSARHLCSLFEFVVGGESADRTPVDADRSARPVRLFRAFADAVLDPDHLHDLAADPSPHQTPAGAASRTRRRHRLAFRSGLSAPRAGDATLADP